MPASLLLPRALVGLHECRTRQELDQRLADDLAGRVPATDLAVCVAAEGNERPWVQFALGPRWAGLQGPVSAVNDAQEVLAIHFRGQAIGELLVGRGLSAEERRDLEALVAHYGAALANLALGEAARRDADDYCLTLQALEQGIVLFQEDDEEALKARLLQQAMSIVSAAAGALYVLRDVGDPASGLQLEQVLGVPESLLSDLRGREGTPWPDALLGLPTQIVERDADGSIALLAPDAAPAVLRRIAVVPLCYHGVEAGLCLLLNPVTVGDMSREVGARLQSFGMLGAALLHRLRLEAVNARNRSRERELQIAGTIQQRMLPSVAPSVPGVGFAWDLLTAQHIGGDYLDLFDPGDGEVRGIVADASGHGINSALLMSSFRSTYRAKAPTATTVALAAALNDAVVDEVGPTGMFITSVIYQLDPRTNRMRLTSAGHTPVLVLRAATGAIEAIDSDGPPLGFMAGAEYGGREIALAAGDTVLLFTDGITEATNGELDMYGEERLAAVLRANPTASAEDLLMAIKHDLVLFTGRKHYDDDVSLVVLRIG
ncbi:MAG: PP2C family protein-serine/threonine phosphatase [Planctomycetes bacterium]|nr:PP2C family protein-serine/threonine phosphatase [Planctomycetota bacterium]